MLLAIALAFFHLLISIRFSELIFHTNKVLSKFFGVDQLLSHILRYLLVARGLSSKHAFV